MESARYVRQEMPWSDPEVASAAMLRAMTSGWVEFEERMQALDKKDGIAVFLEHCVTHVPFYRAMLGRDGENPLEHVRSGGLQSFPVLGRAELIEFASDFLSTHDPAPAWRFWTHTGSTIPPVTTFTDHVGWYGMLLAQYDDIALREPAFVDALRPEQLAVLALDGYGGAPVFRMFMPNLQLSIRESARFGRSRANSGEPFSDELPSLQEDIELVRRLRVNPPPMIHMRPWGAMCMADLDEYCDASTERIRPKVLFLSGGNLYDDHRQRLERWFECPVYNAYGISEGGCVAVQDPGQKDYDVVPRVHLEVRQEDGETKEEGTGEIVLTNLWNWTMPIVRYRTGDWGTLRWGTSEDGYRIQKLSNFFGKTARTFLRAGRLVDPAPLFRKIVEQLPIRHYQVEQRPDESLLFRWVPEGERDHDRTAAAAAIRARVAQHFGDAPLHIEVASSLVARFGKMHRFSLSS